MVFFHNILHLQPYILCHSLQKINSFSSFCSPKRAVRIKHGSLFSLTFESLKYKRLRWLDMRYQGWGIVYFSRVKIYLVEFQLPSWIRYPPTMGPVQLFCSSASFKWFRNQSRPCCTTVTITGASRSSLFISRSYAVSFPREMFFCRTCTVNCSI